MSSQPDQENDLPSSQTFPPSSPLAPSFNSSTRTRKPPSVTPRRFGRFFTPRSSASSNSRAGRELRDITRNGSNRSVRPLIFDDIDERPFKRRKASSEDFQSSPPDAAGEPLSNPCERAAGDEEVETDLEQGEPEEEPTFPIRVRRSKTSHLYTNASQHAAIRSKARHTTKSNHYYTGPMISHDITAVEGFMNVLPFCVAATHHTTLVAVGTEDGEVHILDTAVHTPHFCQSYLEFRPHTNAVMDVAFSPDDSLLATGSGDQSVIVTDMRTQEPLMRLQDHSSSVKQVAWSPGNNTTLTSCSRDGTIRLWDIRTPGALGLGIDATAGASLPQPPPTHTLVPPPPYPPYRYSSQPSTPSSFTRFTPPSITAMSFLPTHPNLFITATDANAHIRLWDIRMPVKRTHSTRSSALSVPHTTPVSTTELPVTQRKRSYGITSISVSAQHSKVFAVSRDSSVYAYSMSHLALGAVPNYNARPQKRWNSEERTGAAPLYAMTNPSFRVGSFYVRSAASMDGDEIAVGSSEHAAIVFPTAQPRQKPVEFASSPHTNTSVTEDNLPIYETGDALINGHDREVTAMSFVRGSEHYDSRGRATADDIDSDGSDTDDEAVQCERMGEAYNNALVTLSDDCMARLWRKRRSRAERAKKAETVGSIWGSAKDLVVDEEWPAVVRRTEARSARVNRNAQPHAIW